MAGKVKFMQSTPPSSSRDNLLEVDKLFQEIGKIADFKAAALMDRRGKLFLAYRMSNKDMATLEEMKKRMFGSVEIGRGIFGQKVDTNNGTTVVSKRISNGMYLVVCLNSKAYTSLAILHFESCAQHLDAILPPTHYSFVTEGDAS